MSKYFKPKKYNFKTADTQFDFDEDLAYILGTGGFEFCDGYSVLHVTREKYSDNINFYVHEFSEIAILGAIRKCTRRWRKMVKYEGFSKADVSHLISPFAYPNKCCIFPDQTIVKPFKRLLYNLTQEERALRDF